MDATRQVVITGIGVVSPIGIGNEPFWKSLSSGVSGVKPISLFDASALPVGFGAELKDFDPKQRIRPRKSLKVMCREIQTAFTAADLAMKDAGLADADVARDRIGTVFGSELLYGEVHECVDVVRRCIEDETLHANRFGEKIVGAMTPLWMLKYLPNMPACHVAISQDARGPNNTIVMGQASSLLAMIEATNLIRRGIVDVVLCGGTGSRLSLTGWLYRGDRDLSHSSGDPAKACRPFDAARDGTVCGEGSACFILEGNDTAEARNANVLGRVAGYGSTIDVGQSLESRQLSIANSIRVAMNSAQISNNQLSHVNAHGLGTVENDIAEARAIRETLGEIPVTAIKSFFGDLGAGSGAVELAASIIGMNQNQIPMTLNYETPDSNCPVNVVATAGVATEQPNLISISQSNAGQAAAIVVESA